MPGVVAVAAGLEVVKLLLMLAFQASRNANLTPEQFEKLYLEQRLAFLSNDPSKIPEV